LWFIERLKDFMNFIYAVKKQNRPVGEVVAASGLSARLPQYDCRDASRGPAEGGWWILSALPSDNYYHPEQQVWHKSVEGDWWVGVDREQKPTPAELIRDKYLTGYNVELGDGNKWIVPVARYFDGKNPLPATMIIGEGGEVEYKPLLQYKWLWDAANRIWDADYKQTDEQVETKERIMICIKALAINYRIGIDEANMLGLFTADTLARCTEAIVDGPRIRIISDSLKQKKSAQTE
jgi:hypothetical protein